MATNGSTAWFAPKRYGYGAGLPINRQGWLATAGFLAALAANAALLEGTPRRIGTLALAAGFVALAYARTEGNWRWRWGDDR